MGGWGGVVYHHAGRESSGDDIVLVLGIPKPCFFFPKGAIWFCFGFGRGEPGCFRAVKCRFQPGGLNPLAPTATVVDWIAYRRVIHRSAQMIGAKVLDNSPFIAGVKVVAKAMGRLKGLGESLHTAVVSL